MSRFLVCPECGATRFQVKNAFGESVVVQVASDYTVVPIHPDTSLEGFDLEIIYCLGCSWSGSPHKLIKYLI
jgi:hypothetical protein